MGAAYGQPPSTWADIGDPDLADEYDEAAHDVGTQIERLQTATKLERAPKPAKNAPQMVQRPMYTNEQINWVLGFVLAHEPDEDQIGSDDLYDALMAGLDDQPPHA